MLLAMFIITVACFVASAWDAYETKRGIREGRIREGNVVLQYQGGLASGRKMAITGIPIGIGWVIFLLGNEAVAVVCLLALTLVFAGFALRGRTLGTKP